MPQAGSLEVAHRKLPAAVIELWPVLGGLLIMYVPTYRWLAEHIWPREDGSHGPLLIAIVAWIFWRKRDFLAPQGFVPRPLAGGILFAFGLLLYVIGRSQSILTFEVGSQIAVISGLILLVRGYEPFRALLVPQIFLLFLVPLPAFVVDMLTAPLRLFVSAAAESMLYSAGYPIARQGVILTIGPYQLLVAQACSGLNSLFSLGALGLLYLYLMQHSGWLRNALLLTSLIPLAIGTNVLRVVLLVLITYHFGDEAGQGFMHAASGLMLFLIALVVLFGLDAILGRILPKPVKEAAR
jgi:exosortase B